MPDYRYTAYDANGSVRSGVIAAVSPNFVAAQLTSMGLTPAAIKAQSRFSQIFQAPPSANNLFAFFRSFAVLMDNQVNLATALDVCSQRETNDRLREALNGIRDDVRAGSTLADAMAKRPAEFKSHYIAFVRAGENGGILQKTSGQLATVVEKDRTRQKKIKSALFHPILVGTFAFATLVFVLTFIVPNFEDMFVRFGVAVEGAPALVFGTANLMKHWWFWSGLVGLIIGVCFAWSAVWRNHNGRVRVERLARRLPKLGPLLNLANTAAVARLIGMLMDCGLVVSKAIDIAAPVSNNQVIRDALGAAKNQIDRGEPIAPSFDRTKAFDPMLIQLVHVGEVAGSTAQMFVKAAECFEEDVDRLTQEMIELIEPLLLLVLGAVVGLLAYCLFIPLYAMISNIK